MPDSSPAAPQKSWFDRLLAWVERTGNALPHPATLFAGLAVLVVLLSWICAKLGVAVTNPANGTTVAAVNLLSGEGVRRMITECARNFINFPPLGVSLMCLLGIGVAEHSGLMGAALRLVVQISPVRWVTAIVVFLGVLSNAGSEVGYVLVIPLAAALFFALGRHPLLGLAAAFAGVSGGYSANLLLSSVDVLLSGLSEAAARIVDPAYQVRPTANYYFLAVSTFVITGLGTWVTEKIVAPRLGDYRGEAVPEKMERLSVREQRGLWAAAGTIGVMTGLVLWGVLPADGFLLARPNGSLADSAFVTGLVTFIFLFGLVPGIVYGVVVGTFRNDHAVMEGMTASMRSMAAYIVLAFFAAQFIAYFNWTNLGIITAVSGARVIEHAGLQDNPTILMIALVLFAGLVNMLIASASAKWALMAPVFVPMFMLLGFTPELVQAAFRVGDSVTNIITPLMGYFPLVLTFAQRYDPKAGIGTMVAMMLPYSLVFAIGWTLLLIVWIWLGWPVGPGAPLYLVR
jgi:aminobenzoyl-glutamate transport protein